MCDVCALLCWLKGFSRPFCILLPLLFCVVYVVACPLLLTRCFTAFPRLSSVLSCAFPSHFVQLQSRMFQQDLDTLSFGSKQWSRLLKSLCADGAVWGQARPGKELIALPPALAGSMSPLITHKYSARTQSCITRTCCAVLLCVVVVVAVIVVRVASLGMV